MTSSVTERLEAGALLEDIVHEHLAIDDVPDDHDFAEAVLELIVNYSDWRDPARAVAALLYAIDAARTHDLATADTDTLLLAKAIAVAPERDDLVIAYLRAVADADYRHERGLAAALETAPPARRSWLAAVDTLAEYRVLVSYFGQDVYDAAMRRSFANARRLGVDAAAWEVCRAWADSQVEPLEVPADLWTRFAS